MLNRNSTKRLERLLERIWSNKTPFIKPSRIFGLLCFRRILNQIRTKLEDKIEPKMLVGYQTT